MELGANKMNKIHFATSNKWKFRQAADYFEKHGLSLKHFPVHLAEPRSEDVYRIAREKVRLAFTKLKKPVFVLDAAYFIKALKNFPKTYIKFADYYIGAKGILKLLEGETDRRWEFANVVCYKDAKEEKIFCRFLKGVVASYLGKDNPNKVRDIDRIFIPEGYKKTFSEFNRAEQGEYDEKVWKPTVFGGLISWLKARKINLPGESLTIRDRNEPTIR